MQKAEKQAEETKKVIANLEAKLTEFRQSSRLKVLDPYRDTWKLHDSGHDFAVEMDLRTGPARSAKFITGICTRHGCISSTRSTSRRDCCIAQRGADDSGAKDGRSSVVPALAKDVLG